MSKKSTVSHSPARLSLLDKSRQVYERLYDRELFRGTVSMLGSLLWLMLWVGVAIFGSRWLIKFLEIEGEESRLTLVTAVFTALVGFGTQQLKQFLEQSRARKLQRIEDARTQVKEVRRDLESKPSTGLHRYVEMRGQTDPIWRDERVRRVLETIWDDTSVELERAHQLFEALPNRDTYVATVKKIGTKESFDAMVWAYRHLSLDWQAQAFRSLLILMEIHPDHQESVPTEVLRDMHGHKPWRAILSTWPHLLLLRDPAPIDPALEAGRKHVGLNGNPFGASRAEADSILMENATRLPDWLGRLQGLQTNICLGATGSGKTATALLLARKSLKEGKVFPIYYPLESAKVSIRQMSEAVAWTLLHYLAALPHDFLEADVAAQSAMAQLLTHFLGPDLALQFHGAGLPLVGEGQKMLAVIRDLMENASSDRRPDDLTLLSLLSRARPESYSYVTILVDVQCDVECESYAEKLVSPLLTASKRLADVGIFSKIFLPSRYEPALQALDSTRGKEAVYLDWTVKGRLETLLRQRWPFHRTQPNSVRDAMRQWYGEPGGVRLSITDRLIEASDGNPRKMIVLGNALLRRIGEKHAFLDTEDIEEILPVYDNKKE